MQARKHALKGKIPNIKNKNTKRAVCLLSVRHNQKNSMEDIYELEEDREERKTSESYAVELKAQV